MFSVNNILFPLSNHLGTQSTSQVFITSNNIQFLTGICSFYSHFFCRLGLPLNVLACTEHGNVLPVAATWFKSQKSRHFIFQPTGLEDNSFISYIHRLCRFKGTKISVVRARNVQKMSSSECEKLIK